jgi:hypothetical protein
MATGRLALAALWNTDTAPASGPEIMSQSYALLELNTASNTMVVDVPFIASTRLLENYNGQEDWKQFSAGIMVLVLVNTYCVPDSGSDTMHVQLFEGAGHDFQLYEPFVCNETVVPAIPEAVLPPEPVEVMEQQMDEVAHVLSADTGCDRAVMLKTVSNDQHVDPHPISEQPQTLRTLLRRSYLLNSFNGNLCVEHGSFTKVCAVSDSSHRPLTGIACVCAAFACGAGVCFTMLCLPRAARSLSPTKHV